MSKINRSKTLSKLISMQRDIQFESDEDEAAAWFFAEIESLIIVVKDQSKTSDEIVIAADYVGLRRNLVYETIWTN